MVAAETAAGVVKVQLFVVFVVASYPYICICAHTVFFSGENIMKVIG